MSFSLDLADELLLNLKTNFKRYSAGIIPSVQKYYSIVRTEALHEKYADFWTGISSIVKFMQIISFLGGTIHGELLRKYKISVYLIANTDIRFSICNKEDIIIIEKYEDYDKRAICRSLFYQPPSIFNRLNNDLLKYMISANVLKLSDQYDFNYINSPSDHEDLRANKLIMQEYFISMTPADII